MITLSICLTDLPKEAIQTGKNGKKYINLVVDKRKAESQFGETHTVYLSQSKEQRDAKADKVYVGGGKEYVFGSNNEQPKQQSTQSKPKAEPQVEDDGLPF